MQRCHNKKCILQPKVHKIMNQNVHLNRIIMSYESFYTKLRSKYIAVIQCGGVNLAIADPTTAIIIEYYQ